jgi:hypothetical protein
MRYILSGNIINLMRSNFMLTMWHWFDRDTPMMERYKFLQDRL